MCEKPFQKCRGRGAVDVVVAEYRHLLASHDRIGQSFGRRLHVGERRGIGQEVADRRVKEALRLLGHDAASGKDAGNQV